MIGLLPEDFLTLMNKLSYEVFFEKPQRPYNLNIIGFRNTFGRPNYFDDTVAIYYQEKGEWIFHFFQATTKPGFPYLLKPISKKGTAILVPGQYKSSFMLGLHRNKYEALVQKEPVKVYRDNNHDLKYDSKKRGVVIYDLHKRTIEEGFFGINIHRASIGAKIVGPNSAGCQVIKDSSDYKKFISLCKKASDFWGNSFSYTLVDI